MKNIHRNSSYFNFEQIYEQRLDTQTEKVEESVRMYSTSLSPINFLSFILYCTTYSTTEVLQWSKSCFSSSELEIQDVVPVDIRTREDGEAVKLLNMLHMIPLLEAGELMVWE